MTLGCAWALAYAFLMTAGPRQTAGWIAWLFSELWLNTVLVLAGWVLYYVFKVLGMLLANVFTIGLLTLFLWSGWNLNLWLQRRERMRGKPERQE
jgi:hypothetical protein